MIFQSIFPVFAMICAGVVLKRAGLTNDNFLKTADRLVYFILFPVLLFWKTGTAPAGGLLPPKFVWAVILAVAVIFIISLVCIRMFGISARRAGAFVQGCYRFNTYVGMAIVMTALGQAQVRIFSILVGIVIPLVNLMAVGTMIWYAQNRIPMAQRLGLLLRTVLKNPFILACLAGMAYSRMIGHFPVFVENTFSLLTLMTLPLALISVGGTLGLNILKGNLGHAALACGVKLVVYPLVGHMALTWLGVSGDIYLVGMIFFALPTSTASYVLSSQLDSDPELAGATIVLSTLLSFFSLSAVLMLG